MIRKPHDREVFESNFYIIMLQPLLTIDPTSFGDFREPDISVFRTPKGLTRATVEAISDRKKEPAWMRERRLHALDLFFAKPMPDWGADLSEINFDNITYYLQPSEKNVSSWDEVPPEVKRTYDRLGIPQAEQKYLAGVGAQYESEVLYHNLQKRLADKGVLFPILKPVYEPMSRW